MITYRRHYTEKKALNFILKWFVDLVFVICLSLMISTFAFSKITMVGHSMENVIVNGDKMFIDKISYKIGNPKRFDIIVFTTDNDNSDTKLIKRVIGLPGEKIYIDSGKIYINGKELKDDVVHDRSVVEDELAGMHVHGGVAGDVAGQGVRCELDAAKA